MSELHDTVICNQCLKKCISSHESKHTEQKREQGMFFTLKHAALCTLAGAMAWDETEC